MGLLIDGAWTDQWYDTQESKGAFERQPSQFQQWVRADGSTPFSPEPNRYHLYVSLACPWAHRTLIFRRLKGLEDVLSVSVVHPLMGEKGWEFREGPGCTTDPLYDTTHLHQLYTRADPRCTTRVTVPILWDKQTHTLVNNESANIIRMLNTEFNALTDVPDDYFPPHLREAIDAINARVYHGLNNGVYRAGFATTQATYDQAVHLVFETLDHLESLLKQKRYLTGDQITEADWRLFPTLIRFDAVYHGHFKCNRRLLREYTHLWNYTLELAQVPGIEETINLDHIVAHYYGSHPTINPSGIVPIGSDLKTGQRHNRADLFSESS